MQNEDLEAMPKGTVAQKATKPEETTKNRVQRRSELKGYKQKGKKAVYYAMPKQVLMMKFANPGLRGANIKIG